MNFQLIKATEKWLKNRGKRTGDIIFVDNILRFKEEIDVWEPYLIMGVFKPSQNAEFFDGIFTQISNG